MMCFCLLNRKLNCTMVVNWTQTIRRTFKSRRWRPKRSPICRKRRRAWIDFRCRSWRNSSRGRRWKWWVESRAWAARRRTIRRTFQRTRRPLRSRTTTTHRQALRSRPRTTRNARECVKNQPPSRSTTNWSRSRSPTRASIARSNSVVKSRKSWTDNRPWTRRRCADVPSSRVWALRRCCCAKWDKTPDPDLDLDSPRAYLRPTFASSELRSFSSPSQSPCLTHRTPNLPLTTNSAAFLSYSTTPRRRKKCPNQSWSHCRPSFRPPIPHRANLSHQTKSLRRPATSTRQTPPPTVEFPFSARKRSTISTQPGTSSPIRFTMNPSAKPFFD